MIADQYLQDRQAELAPATVKRKMEMVGGFLRWLQAQESGRLHASMLTRQLMESYYLVLLSPQTGRHLHGRSKETARKHMEELRIWWTWAWERGDQYGEAIPAPRVPRKRKTPTRQRRAPTWEQMDAVIEHCEGWIYQAAVMMRHTGLRVDSQVLQLRWEHVDLEEGVLYIAPEMGKTQQEQTGRWVPMSSHLIEEVAGWGRREGWLVECPRQVRKLRARDMSRAWVRAGVEPMVWQGRPSHAFRAGVKSGLTAAGIRDKAVDFFVGHAVSELDRAYLDPRALELVRAAGSIPKMWASEHEQGQGGTTGLKMLDRYRGAK